MRSDTSEDEQGDAGGPGARDADQGPCDARSLMHICGTPSIPFILNTVTEFPITAQPYNKSMGQQGEFVGHLIPDARIHLRFCFRDVEIFNVAKPTPQLAVARPRTRALTNHDQTVAVCPLRSIESRIVPAATRARTFPSSKKHHRHVLRIQND